MRTESPQSTKYRALSKAFRKEMQKPNPDKETLRALDMEIKKIEDNPSFQESIKLIKK